MRTFRSIDEYIHSFPSPTQRMLQQMRRTIHASAPGSEEAISYGIPTFKLNGNLVHFAGYENHIGFYPGSTTVKAFKNRLSTYKSSKGAVQFPIDKPLPLALIRHMVQFRVATTVPSDPFEELAAPARRALRRAGITSVNQLSKVSERVVAELHGVGPNAVRMLRKILHSEGLGFKQAVKTDGHPPHLQPRP